MGAVRLHPKHSLPKKRKPNTVQCNAVVEDYKNGATGYNLRRYITVPDVRRCQRNAVNRLGKLCFCAQHTKLALEGLVDDDGVVATRSALADVRRYPQKFVGGLYSWAENLKPEEIK